MNLLVTGGCGFIGSNFVRLVLGGLLPVRRLVNLDKLSYAGNPANLEGVDTHPAYVFAQGDIADAALLERLFAEHRFDAVVNFAAESHVDRSIDGPRPFVETNVVGTYELLQAARRHWNGCEGAARDAFRFLHVSTDEVFGSLGPEDPAFTETTPYSPRSPYSATKAASDHLVQAWHHTFGLPVLLTNCSNNYGPYQFPEKLLPVIILNAVAGRPLPIYGDGGNVRDWLFVEDHCTAIAEVLRRGRLGETYNIGGESERTNLEVVDTVCAILDEVRPRASGRYADLKTFVKDRPGHDRRYAMNISKIAAELGWSPSVTFQQGMERTVRWYLDHGPWCDAIVARGHRLERLGKG